VKDVPGDYYRRLQEVDSTHWWHRGMRGIARSLLGDRLERGGSLLDAGCGTGGFLAWAAATGSFDRLCGVDLSPEAVELSRAVVPEADVRVAPLDALPFEDTEFDLAVSLDVLQHVHTEALDRSLREVRRVLRPGGSLLVRTNGACRVHRERDDWQAYDAATLVADLRRAGLAVQRVTYANTVLSLAAALQGRVPHAPTATASGIPRRDGEVKSAVGTALLGLESRLLTTPWGRLPYGHTLFALAEREDAP
jgi:SAM-dependent methyltransferase